MYLVGVKGRCCPLPRFVVLRMCVRELYRAAIRALSRYSHESFYYRRKLRTSTPLLIQSSLLLHTACFILSVIQSSLAPESGSQLLMSREVNYCCCLTRKASQMGEVPKMGAELINQANIGRELTERIRGGGGGGGWVHGCCCCPGYVWCEASRYTAVNDIYGAAVCLSSTTIPLSLSRVVRKDAYQVYSLYQVIRSRGGCVSVRTSVLRRNKL